MMRLQRGIFLSACLTTTVLSLRLRLPIARRKLKQDLYTREELSEGIAGFYDRSSGLWESMWGEHMHHGYYPSDAPAPRTMDEHRAAQVDMIDRVLDWAGPPTSGGGGGGGGGGESGGGTAVSWRPKRVLDVGCGIGGSTRHIARRFAESVAKGTGITLSPFQRGRAEALSTEAGLGDKLSFRVENALQMPEEWKDSYDLVWSLESGEHMPEKTEFVKELCRVTAPGGRIIIVTWCHRDLELASRMTVADDEDDAESDEEGGGAKGEACTPADVAAAQAALVQAEDALAEEEAWPAVVDAGVGVELEPLTRKEERLLSRINRAYYLPRWCSVADYVQLLEAEGCINVRRADWTREIAAFWPAVIKSSLTLRGLLGLARSGFTTIRGAVAMLLMVKGYKSGLIVFGLITAEKPANKET